MQLRPRNKLNTGVFASTDKPIRRKSDRPRSWSWNHKAAKPSKCVVVFTNHKE